MKTLLFQKVLAISILLTQMNGPKAAFIENPSTRKDSLELTTKAFPQFYPVGISEQGAKDMVKTFRRNIGKYSRKTSCWFPYEYLVRLDSMLKADKASAKVDGFRIYLARMNRINTFLIVPTTDYGPNSGAPSGRDHLDRFLQTLTTTGQPVAQGLEEDGNDPGARLYNNPGCPVDGIIDADHYISCKEAIESVTNFSDDDDINTFSEWFNTSMIDNLVSELSEAKKQNVAADGVRVYLARHKDTQNTPFRHIFIFTTTKTNGGKHTDYYETYYHPRSPEKTKSLKDNGEQCLTNCHGATLQ